MSKQKKLKIKDIVCWGVVVLVCLALLAAGVFVVKDISAGDTLLKRISVMYNGETLKDDDSVELPESGQALFEVENGGKYTVQVFPNVTEETDFNFVVGGVPRSFLSQGDFGERFVSPNNKAEKYFSMSCSYEKFTVEGLLLVLYGSSVQVETDIEYPFRLVVTGSNGSSVTVNLRQYNSEKSIEFDFEGDIVF